MLLFTTQYYVDIMIPDFFGILCIGIHRQVIFVAVVSPVPTIVIRARGIRWIYILFLTFRVVTAYVSMDMQVREEVEFIVYFYIADKTGVSGSMFL